MTRQSFLVIFVCLQVCLWCGLWMCEQINVLLCEVYEAASGRWRLYSFNWQRPTATSESSSHVKWCLSSTRGKMSNCHIIAAWRSSVRHPRHHLRSFTCTNVSFSSLNKPLLPSTVFMVLQIEPLPTCSLQDCSIRVRKYEQKTYLK